MFHLPRATHIELFMNIKRYTPLAIASLSLCVLRFALQRAGLLIYRHTTMAYVLHTRRIMKSGAPLLISVPEEAGEGTSNNWLGGSTMYWSALHTHTHTHPIHCPRAHDTHHVCAWVDRVRCVARRRSFFGGVV